ncbi:MULTISPECIES: acyl carrier protein [Amycolatopsis]|uniref:Acyl carrier protein n=1 Tax=Amycolatopsis alkalitolerans TaxID=2547244 RepID=A0A5C4LVV0_9PSEU|nr:MULTISPECIES: acyl carrier protein [Amycolatopsis]TNC22069.1 acyl carrier protein [Amycolatopsis alkalitolerans]
MSDVSRYLSVVLSENFEVVAEDIAPETTLDDLGVDSVATIELVDILQEKFGIKIADEELTNKNTVEQVIDTVTAKVGG